MSLLFHHIGVACLDLDSETRRLAALGYAVEGDDFSDTIQGVRGRFLNGGGPRLELLSPLSEAGVLTPWLKSGVKLYHLAYQTKELDGEIARMRSAGAKIVVAPVPAVAFEKRRIAFLMMPNMLLTELIEIA
ncbi:MAG TPA: VOC family protein [Verrucomicrobiae bacterium]